MTSTVLLGGKTDVTRGTGTVLMLTGTVCAVLGIVWRVCTAIKREFCLANVPCTKFDNVVTCVPSIVLGDRKLSIENDLAEEFRDGVTRDRSTGVGDRKLNGGNELDEDIVTDLGNNKRGLGRRTCRTLCGVAWLKT